MCTLALGQPSEQSTLPPDIFVTVSKTSGGADVVTVTARKETYLPEVLMAQCQEVGIALGNSGRGFEVNRTDLGTAGSVGLLRASFAVNGLIDRATGGIDLESLCRPFLGVAEPNTVLVMLVNISDETAGFATVKRWRTDNVLVLGRQLQNPPGIEYRVEFYKQDPTGFTIPRLAPEEEAEKVPEKPAPTQVNPLMYAALGTALVSAGALVYFALLRPVPKSRP